MSKLDYGQQVLAGLQRLSEQRDIDRPRDSIGLSEVGKCPRRLWYQSRGYSKSNNYSPESYMLFELGNQVEDSIIKGLEASGVLVVGRQMEVELEGIKGHIDGVILEPLPKAGPNSSIYEDSLATIKVEVSADPTLLNQPIYGFQRLLLECKSISEYGYNSLAKNGLEQTYYDYYIQIQAYARAMNADAVAFVAVNKGGGGKSKGVVKPIIYYERINVFPGMMQQVMGSLLRTLDSPTVPERPYTAPAFACSYCPFERACWEDTKNGYDR